VRKLPGVLGRSEGAVKQFTIKKAVAVDLPTTRDDWELYDVPRVGTAARNLTAALKRACRAPTDDEARAIMNRARDAAADFGACDSEPRYVAQAVLRKVRGEDFWL